MRLQPVGVTHSVQDALLMPIYPVLTLQILLTLLYHLPRHPTKPFLNHSELWCWRRRLRVPWTARRSKQSILKEISPEYSLEGLMLKLQLQYFGHLM